MMQDQGKFWSSATFQAKFFSPSSTFRSLWAKHILQAEVTARDHGNDRPSFQPDVFYDYDVNDKYTKVSGLLI